MKAYREAPNYSMNNDKRRRLELAQRANQIGKKLHGLTNRLKLLALELERLSASYQQRYSKYEQISTQQHTDKTDKTETHED